MKFIFAALTVIAAFADAFQTITPKPAFAGPRTTSISNTAISLAASNINEKIPLRKGSSCAIVTPFTKSGAVDVPALRKLLQFHLQGGTDNLCVLGTTGEASTLSMAERATVLTTAVEEVKGKIPILAGTGTIDPKHVKEMTLQAMEIGCDASLVVTPYYVKPPQRGLVKHFLTMADLGLPVVIYNIPGRAKVDFESKNIAICADHENIVGLKDATGDLSRVEEVRNLVGNDFLMYSGDDSTSPEYVMRGGDGCISVTANVAPAQLHELMMASLKKDVSEVERINGPLNMLHKALFCESSPMPVKWAAMKMGLINSDYCRPPLDVLEPQFYPEVEKALNAAGLLPTEPEPILDKFDKLSAKLEVDLRDVKGFPKLTKKKKGGEKPKQALR